MIKILQILVVNLPLVFDTSGVLLASGTDLIASKELGKAIDAIQKAGSVSEGLANSDAKISISIGTSKSVSTSHTKQTTHQGSELSAGSVTVRATEGDNTLVGTKINAKEATIEGSNINLLGTTDTQTNRSDNKSSSWSVGVFMGKSGSSTGLGIEGAASVGKGYANSDSQVQNHTEINADRLTMKANETTTLKGATANINHLALDTKNLHIESVQDIEKYNSKQTQGGVKAALAWGSGASGSAQFSRNKANVDYAQVNQQSGFNINESSDINVKENTHLKGGVINAQGDKANHSLKTGTLTTESIENRSDIKVSTVTAGASTDMTQMATSAMGAALSALGNTNESERSQTQAAISANINVQITDSEKQKSLTGKTAEEALQSLNRDVANANQKLEKQDLQALQERQEMAQVIGELSQAGINHLVGDKLKEADKKRQEADAIEKENPEKATALRAQAQAIEAEYGLGSNLQMGIRAATAALQGLATGNVNQAAVGALSPYLNKLIKEQTGDNKEANLIAHAVLGAVEAHFTGNNAAAGALGALTAEVAAPLIMQTLYGTEKPENLTDSQKQNVANLSQIAAGLSGGLVGDSTGSFVAGAEIGKRAVENNFLDQIMENPQADWQSVAQGQQAKLETEQQIREYLKQEHPVIYQTAEGTYYFLSKTGKAIYITREIVIDVAPFIVAPEMAAGTGFYSLISRAALSGGANVVAQGISGQQFNSVELTGAIVSGTVSPVFKRTIDVIRFNAGVGMATGLANGGDGLSDAALSGIATYGSMKISNPILATGVGEVIQKAPVIIQSTVEKHDKDK